MPRSHTCARLALLATFAVAPCMGAEAAPITITTPFFQLDNVAVNTLGNSVGQRLRLGANSVVPNGLAVPPTTGVATTSNLVTGTAFSRTIGFSPDTVSPNFFIRTLPDDPGLRGPWSLTFTNGADVATTTVTLPANARHVDFVRNVAVSGSSFNPTFTWNAPANGQINGYRVNLYDRSRQTLTGGADNVFSQNLTTTSFTVPTQLSGGLSLDPTHAYTLEINAFSTRDGGSSVLSNSNVFARSRSFFDFAPIVNGPPVVNLPVLTSTNSFQFEIAVIRDALVYIDPVVAIGYDYAIGDGDPNFRSVVLPVGIGDGLYDLYALDTNGAPTLLIADLAGGTEYDFGAAGLTRFRVLDIEVDAALDPRNTAAFITGLRFTRDGTFTGTMTPISVEVADAVSAPGTLSLLVTALWGLIRRRLTGVA
jgi:hypothetical protein